jgi:hypothetical protein
MRRGVLSLLPLSAAHVEPVTLWSLWPTALPLACLLLADGGYPAVAALQAPCPPFPLAEGIGSDVAALARAMGRDAEEVEAGVFAAAAMAFQKAIKVAREVLLIAARSEVDPNNGEHRAMTYHPGILSWSKVVEGYGVGCSFADVRVGREWPEAAE